MSSRPRLVAAAAVALVVTAAGYSCAPAAQTCPAGQVAEWDDDGLECEPDANGNGIDDEDEGGHGSSSHVRIRPQTTRPVSPSSSPTYTASPRPIKPSTLPITTDSRADRASDRRSPPSRRSTTTK